MTAVADEVVRAEHRGRLNYGRAGGAAATLLLLAVLAMAPLFASTAVLNDLGQAVVLGLLAVSFNLPFRYAGLLSFGHAAYFGIAAYAEALALRAWPAVPAPLLVALAGFVCGLLGLALGVLCVRRAGAYFSMTTLAIAAFFATLAMKWTAVTGGTDGLSGFVPSPLVLVPGWSLAVPSIAELYKLVLVLGLPAALALQMLFELTPFGHAVQRTRDNAERAAFLGYDTHRLKLATFGLAASLAGVAGALWAIVNGFVSTDSIDLTLSTTLIIMAFIGGTAWFWGPLLGAVIYIFGSDRLSALTPHWQIWLGLAFIALVLVLPGGAVELIRRGLSFLSWRRYG